VVSENAAAPLAAEEPPPRLGLPEGCDEGRKVLGKSVRPTRVGINGDRSRQPCLDRPWHGVTHSRLSQGDGFRGGEPRHLCQLRARLGFLFQNRQRLGSIGQTQWETRREVVPDAEDGVDRSSRRKELDRPAAPLWELFLDQGRNGFGGHVHLVIVHGHLSQALPPVQPETPEADQIN
jgi:hypothetical protein